MKKPRICFIVTSLNIGGTEKIIASIVSALKEKYDFTAVYIKEKGIIGNELEQQGIVVRRCASILSLILYLKKNKFDIIHTALYRANIFGRIAGKLSGTPIILSFQQAIDSWKKTYHSWIDAYTARWCSEIIANSQAAKNILIQREHIPAYKISVIYNGIDMKAAQSSDSRDLLRSAFNIPSHRIVITYVGRLHKEKGTDLLPKIADELLDYYMLVVGDGPGRASLERIITTGPLRYSMRLLGWRNDITAIMKMSDILILPSREESFPQVILEAMYQAIPVVAADVGSVSELVEHGINGFLVEPENTDGFTRSLNELIMNKSLRVQMGATGKERSFKYSLERMISEIDARYTTFLKEKSNMEAA